MTDTQGHYENWYEGYLDSLHSESKMSEAEIDEYLDNVSDEQLKELYTQQTQTI